MESTFKQKSSVWSTGFAMFAMFFGAGNIVFPLAIGQLTQDKNLFASVGMLITAVIVPLLGLLSMLLFEGNYEAFFRRIGKWPGFLVSLMILGVIGPFGGIPRCITISHSTLEACGLSNMSLPLFGFLSVVVVFLFTFRPSKIITLLGYVLTPVLLISLAVIVFKGIFTMDAPLHSSLSKWETFRQGFLGGYNTMDLLAAFFFSSCVLLCLRDNSKKIPLTQNKYMLSVAVTGSFIAALLLALVYVSFSFLAAGYSHELGNVANHQMLGRLAFQLLGPYAGLVAGLAVSFACLTTEIALTAVFTEYLRKTLLAEKLSYEICVVITLAIAFLISTLHFEGISQFLAPLLQICYPALIALAIVNILHKLYAFKPVKSFVYTIFAATLLSYLIYP